jgi:predicted  nucleic acid-binding Zn-ribbon protein
MIEMLGAAVGALGQWFSELSPTMKTVIVATGAIVAAAGPVLLFLGTMATMIPIVTTAFLSMNAAMAASPLGAMAMVVGTLAAAFGVAYIKTKDFDKSTNEAATSTHALEKITRELTAAEKELAKAKSEGKDITDESTKSIVQETSARIKQAESIITSLKAQRAELEARIGKLTNPTFGLPSKSDIKKASELAEQLRSMDAQIKESEMTILRMAETMYDLSGDTQKVGETVEKVADDFKIAGKTVGELQARYDSLSSSLEGLIPNSKEYNAVMAEMAQIKAVLNPKVIDDLDDSLTAATNSLAELQNKMKYASGLDFTPGKKASAGPAGPQPVGGPVDGGTSGIDWNSLESQMNLVERLASVMGGTFVQLGDTIRASMVNAAVGIGVLLGQMAAGVEGGISFADVMSSAFADLMGSLGKMMIEAGVAKIAFDMAMLIPGGAIGAILAGTALVAAASAISSSLGGNGTQGVNAPPKFAKGGAVTGPTLAMVGENPASRGEAIIPFERMGSFLSQFTGMGGGGVQQVVVTGQIAGDTIRLSNQKSTINTGRVRWERGTGRA